MRPNILIFNPDEFRADALSHLGNPACKTPYLDRFAENEGVSFSHAFCQNPVCTPSRCSFMSGWYPHTAGHRTMNYMLHEHEPVLLEILKNNGYYVWWGGKNDLIPGNADFDRYCDVHYQAPKKLKGQLHRDQSWRSKPGEKGYYSMCAGCLGAEKEEFLDRDAWDVNGAADFLDHYEYEKPFCMFLALKGTHPPYGVEEPYYSSADEGKIRVISGDSVDYGKKPSMLRGIRKNQNLFDFTEEDWKEVRKTYYGMCSRVDALFGKLCEKLKEVGHYDDTLILFLSDHGDFAGDYGLVEKNQNTFEDCLTRVPFLIKPPKSEPVVTGIRDSLEELVDLPATVLDYAGIPLHYSQFGRSLRGEIEGTGTISRNYVFSEGGRLAGEDQCRENMPDELDETSIYYPRTSCQTFSDTMHTKAIMIRSRNYKYVYRLYEDDEFYDLQGDPDELHNQIENKNFQNEIMKMKGELLRFLVETADTVPVEKDPRL